MRRRARGRNAEVDFKGEKRSNATHASTTDPDARLYRKSDAAPAVLGYLAHGLMENRSGLIVDVETPPATGAAERDGETFGGTGVVLERHQEGDHAQAQLPAPQPRPVLY